MAPKETAEHQQQQQQQQAQTQAQAKAAGGAEQCCCTCGGGGANGPPPLFEDQDFPARWHVLCSGGTAAANWLRPHELCAEPRLFKQRCSRFAAKQGCIGDCWFIASCAALAQRPDLLHQVVPEGQVLFGPGYDGSVRFRLWHLGEWQEVRVDDRLPVDARGAPVYARCLHKDEFWLPLLEKAFAKFHKHYGIIDKGGWASEGLINLTGFSMQLMVLESWNVWDTDKHFQRIKYAADNEGLILPVAKGGPGLPGNHVYTVTKVYERDARKEGEEKLRLLRVRNPWGNATKWCGGAWKDGDERWERLSKEEKKELEYNPEENGEFWMDIEDFKKNFVDLVIATQKPEGTEEMKVVGQITGQWSDDEEVGGNHSEIEKFAKNPQFSLVLLGCDEPEPGQEEQNDPINGVDVIIELLRGHCRKKVFNDAHIAFYVFEGSGERRLSAERLRALERVEGATEAQREVAVSARLRLQPGRRYVVVAATEHPGQEGDFLLRVFSRRARVRLAPLPP